MKMKRTLAALSALTLIVSGAAGCKKNNGAGGGEQVKLKYLMPGPGMQEDSQKVWKVFNEKLQEKLPNVTVDFEIIPLSEYAKKFTLMCSAREQIDIVNAYWLSDATNARNGTFEPLDDLVEKYGQDIKKALPEWIMDYGKVDGKLYTIPTYQMCGAYRGIVFIKEQAEKYLDIEKFQNTLWSSNYMSDDVYDMLTKYMDDMKADGLTFRSACALNLKGVENVCTPNFGVKYGDEKATVRATFIDDDQIPRYKYARKWVEMGYTRSDELSSTDQDNFKGKKDGYPFWDEVYTPFAAESLSEKYGVDVIMIPYENYYYTGFLNSASGTAIMSNSEHKEEAMQVINLIQTDKDLYNLLVFGIEGEHYKKIGEDQIETPTGQSPTANDKYGLYKWIVGNTELAYNLQTEPEDYKKWVFEEANASDKKSPIIGLKFDKDPIADYITQVSALQSKYLGPLTCGAMENWEDYLAEYKAEMEKAGSAKIIAELQKQVDEFLASK